MAGILETIANAATKYAPLIKTGVAALSTYASYKDQQKKNQMQQAAYDDYIRDVAAAGDEASAAVALNLTPMTVSGVPQTKADVTDFTAVAAGGGLMSIPNKQRKRYAKGPEVFDVETMDEEVITPFNLQQETGIDLTGEQVKYDQGSPRKNAAMVWGNMGTSDKEPYNFDFDIFFQSGDWMDMIKSEIGGGGDTQVASSPDGEPFMMEEFLEAVQEGFKGSYQDYLDQIDRRPEDYWGQAPSAEGIMQAAKGGRIGYNIGQLVTPGPGRPGYGGGARGWQAQMKADEIAEDMGFESYYDMPRHLQHKVYSQALIEIDEGLASIADMRRKNEAQGGRIGYESGSESGYTFEDFVKEKRQIDQYMSEEELKEQYEKLMRGEKIKEQKQWAAQGGRIGYDIGGISGLRPQTEESSKYTRRLEVEMAKKKALLDIAQDQDMNEENFEQTLNEYIEEHGSSMGINMMAHELGYWNNWEGDRDPNELDATLEMPNYIKRAKGGRIGYRFGDEVIADQEAILKTPNEEIVVNDMEEIKGQTADYKYRIQQYAEQLADDDGKDYWEDLSDSQRDGYYKIAFDLWGSGDMFAKGGRVKKAPGGIMDLGGVEKDYRTTGGFVPLGGRERADDVPARLSKNEFVMTADAVRAAGGGSINRGAQRMYDTMKHLEASPQSRRMTA